MKGRPALATVLLVVFAVLVAAPAGARTRNIARRVDPFIGTGGHGHTYPGPALPFGMIQPGPDTRLAGWDGCSGYHYSDSTVYGFSHTHLSGTGVGDYCDILFLPATGPVKLRNNYENPAHDGYGSRFQKRNERAEAGYYRTTLDDYGVDVELTATPRTAWHRYTFHRAGNAHVLIDLTHRDEVLDSYVRIVGPRRIEGMRRSKSWAKDQIVYFAAEFDRDVAPELFVDDTAQAGANEARGKNVKAALHFDVKRGARVRAKVALSSVDEAGAWKNLEAEARGWDFGATRTAARHAWNQALSKIKVEGGTDEQTTIFYTALYHTMLQPNLLEDVDGRFRGMDGQVHDSPGYTRYTVFSLWDTFRAAHPLYTIIERERTLEFIQTFLAMYKETGRLPVWELWGNETDCMIGYHAVSVITDAYVKGIRGFDEKLALDAMMSMANSDRGGLPAYRKYGYIPADMESESVSKTLEYAYDDWCIVEFAKAAGLEDRYKKYELRARSQSWVHLMDRDGFFHPRADGRWVEPFDPTEVTFHFTEANAWQYRFFVADHSPYAQLLPQSAPGRETTLESALDALFKADSHLAGREQADITGLIGQYAHGNEPGHNTAYLYVFADASPKTQKMVARIRDEMYRATPDGLVGNEDCGQMSAWYVLSAMGFYPVTPGGELYVIGTPLFDVVRIRPADKPVTTIRARGGSAGKHYIRSGRLRLPGRRDWADYPYPILVPEQFERGGELEFEMSSTPGPWGRTPQGNLLLLYTEPAPVAEGASVFVDSVRVHLRGEGIRYTRDPRSPDSLWTWYEGPFTLHETTHLRFRAGHSPIVEASFRKIDPRVKITERNPVHHQYQAGGSMALIDGIRGGTDFRLGTWQGIYGVDLDTDIDLGETRTIHRLATGFLHDQNSWIFFPLEVIYWTSDDGETWTLAGIATNDLDPHHDGVVIQDFAVELATPVRARYVRVRGTSPIMCPDWHKGAGNQAFIFADEVIVE